MRSLVLLIAFLSMARAAPGPLHFVVPAGWRAIAPRDGEVFRVELPGTTATGYAVYDDKIAPIDQRWIADNIRAWQERLQASDIPVGTITGELITIGGVASARLTTEVVFDGTQCKAVLYALPANEGTAHLLYVLPVELAPSSEPVVYAAVYATKGVSLWKNPYEGAQKTIENLNLELAIGFASVAALDLVRRWRKRRRKAPASAPSGLG